MKTRKHQILLNGSLLLLLTSIGLSGCFHDDSDSDDSSSSPLVGSWYYAEPPLYYIVVTFLDNKTYVMVNDEEEANEIEAQDGFEIGSYSWNEDGVFTASARVDTNGEWGLSHPCENEVLTLTLGSDGNTLTLEADGEVGEGCSGDGANDAIVFNKVASAAEPLIGSWMIVDNKSQDHFALVSFMEDGRYLMMQNGPDDEDGTKGIESGTYNSPSDADTYQIEADVDTNGSWGLHEEGGENLHKLLVNGDTLTGQEAGSNASPEKFELRRIK